MDFEISNLNMGMGMGDSASANVSASGSAPVGDASIDLELIERRRVIRPLPVAHVVERNDDEVWELWSKASLG